MRHLLYLAKRWKKFFGENPVSESGLLKVNNLQERILSPEEENRLIMNSSPHLVPILITALNTGMRKGEIISLRWEDIDFENNLITVRQEVSKSKKLRRIPINSTLRKVLLEQKLKTGWNDYVFLNPEGSPYQRSDSLKRCFEGACRRANIKGFRFHDLRHTFATRLIKAGVSIVVVSKILGHADLKTTMRYVHPEDSLKDAVEKLTKMGISNSLTDKFTDTGESQ
ncbi:MAG TPA: site-specific integrase [Thermodesulfobacteriota bacterium]|nr:site-specific integrase [Thermodesulfobacteriota bacterium]